MTRPIKEYTEQREIHAIRFGLNREIRKSGGDWIYVVNSPTDPLATPESPFFENNWDNVGSPWQVLRFRWLVDGTVEIEGVVEGGDPDTVIFTLPTPLYIRNQANDGDIPVPGVNVTDNSHVAFKIATDGSVYFLG